MGKRHVERQATDGIVYGSWELDSKGQRREAKKALRELEEPEPRYYSGKAWFD